MHETFVARRERSPLQKAWEYQRRMQEMSTISIREFARRTGEDWSVVSRHLRTLRLPEEITNFLDQNQTPEVLRHFTVKRLYALTRLSDTEATASFMQEVCEITPREFTTPA